MSGFAVSPFGQIQRVAVGDQPEVPPAGKTWNLDGDRGWGWIYYSDGAINGTLRRPIILSDGFSLGESDRVELYQGLNFGQYALISQLQQRGFDVIIVGYRDRSASILDNTRVVTECIMRAIQEREGSTPLVVGGFSMGGIVTRYALAKLESDGVDHETSHYISYDAPHRGAWIPISLQSFAYYVEIANGNLVQLIKSPAARQMLWRQKNGPYQAPAEHPDRREFLRQLELVGWWPLRPYKIGVANGRGDGEGNGFPPGEVALRVTGGIYKTTELYLQGDGPDRLVAYLKAPIINATRVYTQNYPELDSAPGGTLDSFGIAADALNSANQPTEAPHPSINFIPTVSALAVDGADIGVQADLDLPANNLSDRIELDAFRASSANTGHTEITRELCEWILEQLPRK
ncbi:esterase/lipase family protein [Streptacidiphilus albus]|uniref:esterase/lipase family protein n=1 Tax=Streptacidiphilus albus TaxID=105425 RepID=UPI00054B545B|nr:alpha/beta hydrolase [Streptacidiphilus albus]